MISAFNNTPIQLGSFAASFNPACSRTTSAATEIVNEIYWLLT